MSRPMSSTNASLRYSSTSQQATVLAMRIESKKAELENLKQLRDLSNALAGQMHALEEKLATLKDGTECMSSKSCRLGMR
jgi:DASH complex subunit DAD2